MSQTQPFFALPATLTLYAHEIESYGEIARLFDFLLASEAVIPVYLFAVVRCSPLEPLFQKRRLNPSTAACDSPQASALFHPTR